MITPEQITKCCDVCGEPTKNITDELCIWCYKLNATHKKDLIDAWKWFTALAAIAMFVLYQYIP